MTASAPAVQDSPPVPQAPDTIDDLVASLRELRGWAGNPSYTTLAKRVARLRQARGVPASEATPGRVTVYDCFREGRRRLDADLVVSLVAALGADREAQTVWRRSIRRVMMPGAGPVQAEAVFRPAPPAGFVGRQAELDEVLTAAATGSVVLEGMPGVGKTALAVHAAHVLGERLGSADPVLVNLRGFTSTDSQPVDPESVADALLGALDPGVAQPAGRRFEALQAVLARGAVVLVLDNAASAEQVELLVPPADSPSRALVTTRRQLTEVEGAHRVRLGPLDRAAAEEALETAAGRPLPDRAAVRGLSDLAGRLPLALSLMGRRVAARPDWPLTDHLAAYRERLDRLHLDEGVAVALGVSYAELAPEDQQVLRALAWHPGQTFGTDAVVALAGIDHGAGSGAPDSGDVGATLERLVEANLVRAVDGRWELHDLVRTFAAARSVEADPPSARDLAVRRLAERYVEQAAAAVGALHPQAIQDWTWVDRAELAQPGEEDARDWLDAERVNLLACAGWASQHGEHEQAIRLAAVLAHDLWQRGDVDTTLEMHRAAVGAAVALDDPCGEALAQRNLGNTLLRVGRYEAGRPHLDQAVRLFRAAGHSQGELSSLSSLAILASATGDQAAAIETFSQIVEQFRAADEPDERLALTMSNLAVALIRDGRSGEARELLEESADLAAEHGWSERERNALTNVAHLLVDDGRPEEALRAVERALVLSEEADDPVTVGYARSNLGVVLDTLGRGAEADEHWRAALAAGRDLEVPELAASVLNHIGDAHLGRGDHEAARTAYEEALAVADEISEATETARARDGLGRLAGEG